MKTVKAYHFCSADMALGYADGREIVVGETLTVDCEPKLCEQGLHASEDILDALSYSAGPMLCEVEIGGKIVRGDDKLVGQSRKCLSALDCTETLQHWACDVAEHVLPIFEEECPDDQRPRNAIEAKRAYLAGEITAAARDAARAAAGDAAWAAARDATRVAAWDAARDAARAAAWDAEKDWQRARLLELITIAREEADDES